MLPGDVRQFEGPKAIAITLGVWAVKGDKWIEIHLTGDGEHFSHTTVNNNPASARYHRTIFRNMRRLLVANNKWSYGDEGAETEEEKRVG